MFWYILCLRDVSYTKNKMKKIKKLPIVYSRYMNVLKISYTVENCASKLLQLFRLCTMNLVKLYIVIVQLIVPEKNS